MSSRRVYITLNDEKEKDKVIIDYLSQSYSESDAIKEILYKVATNSTQTVQTIPNSNNKVQSTPQKNIKREKDTKSKGNSKVLKGADNTDKVEKVHEVNTTSKVLNGADSIPEVQPNTKSIIKEKNDALRANELEQLKKFM